VTEALILGTAQDGGLPQPGCGCRNCETAREDPSRGRLVSSLGLVTDSGRGFLIDATPDFREQVTRLPKLSGILLTHAHMGHIAGLLWLGREAMAVRELPLWVGPRMLEHLTLNEPWAALIREGHLLPRILREGEAVLLDEGLTVIPVPVRHRAEWSETFAFRVTGRDATILWLPDIDALGTGSLSRLLEGIDIAFLDGTFYSGAELPHRDLGEIPHPMVADTLSLLATLKPAAEIHFVHLNHTNPLWDPASPEVATLKGRARVAVEGSHLHL
jgi:pyrroloquinoline quinone biosynthesis protein B